MVAFKENLHGKRKLKVGATRQLQSGNQADPSQQVAEEVGFTPWEKEEEDVFFLKTSTRSASIDVFPDVRNSSTATREQPYQTRKDPNNAECKSNDKGVKCLSFPLADFNVEYSTLRPFSAAVDCTWKPSSLQWHLPSLFRDQFNGRSVAKPCEADNRWPGFQGRKMLKSAGPGDGRNTDPTALRDIWEVAAQMLLNTNRVLERTPRDASLEPVAPLLSAKPLPSLIDKPPPSPLLCTTRSHNRHLNSMSRFAKLETTRGPTPANQLNASLRMTRLHCEASESIPKGSIGSHLIRSALISRPLSSKSTEVTNPPNFSRLPTKHKSPKPVCYADMRRVRTTESTPAKLESESKPVVVRYEPRSNHPGPFGTVMEQCVSGKTNGKMECCKTRPRAPLVRQVTIIQFSPNGSEKKVILKHRSADGYGRPGTRQKSPPWTSGLRISSTASKRLLECNALPPLTSKSVVFRKQESCTKMEKKIPLVNS